MISEILDWWDNNWYKIVCIALIVVVVAMIGGACTAIVENKSNRINSGVIVDKYMNAGGTYYSSDKNGGHMHSYPPSYSFTIRGEKAGEVVEYTFDVTAEEYAAYKIGDQYQR